MGPEWGTGERGEQGRVAGLADRDGGGWGRARRLGSARGAEVGEDRAHGDRVLDGGDDAQAAGVQTSRPRVLALAAARSRLLLLRSRAERELQCHRLEATTPAHTKRVLVELRGISLVHEEFNSAVELPNRLAQLGLMSHVENVQTEFLRLDDADPSPVG